MARIRLTRTIGKKLVEGRIVDLPLTTIRAISEEVGNNQWYQPDNPLGRKMLARGEMPKGKGVKVNG